MLFRSRNLSTGGLCGVASSSSLTGVFCRFEGGPSELRDSISIADNDRFGRFVERFTNTGSATGFGVLAGFEAKKLEIFFCAVTGVGTLFEPAMTIYIKHAVRKLNTRLLCITQPHGSHG